MLVFYSTFTEWLHHRAYSKENFGLHSGDIYGEHGARAYNGGLGTEPQWGQWVRGRSPPEADSILAYER